MVDSAYYKDRPAERVVPRGCPVDHSFSTFSEAYVENPYAELKKRRLDTPAFYSEEMGYLVLTKMEDVLHVFKNPDIFSPENVQQPVVKICDAAREILAADDYRPLPVLSNNTPPDHVRIRKHAHAGFSNRRMQVLEPFVRKRSETLIDAMIEAGPPANFVTAVGHPLPGETIFRLLGFPPEDDPQLKIWTTNRLSFTWGLSTDEEQIAIAEYMLAYWRYCCAHVKRRREEPADDFTTELLAVHDENAAELSIAEIESVVYGLSFAGHEIVSNLLGNTLINLLRNRGSWDEICADPAKIPGAVNESLRIDSPQTSWRRIAQEDTTVAGCDIPKGTEIFMSLGSANHDEDKFPEPETFDIHRKNANHNVSFGHGSHFCLGNRLAILEGTIALQVLAGRLPGLDLVEGQTLSYVPNFTMRGPAELWVRW